MTTRTILLMRHAKSSWADTALTDHDRPLKGRGKRDAPRIGAALREDALVPECIVSSTAVRARDTATLVASHVGYEGTIAHTSDLYHPDPESIVGVLRLLPDDCDRVLVVGHNPGFEDCVTALTGQYERLPTAAVAHIEVDLDSWAELRADTAGRLVSVRRPREL